MSTTIEIENSHILIKHIGKDFHLYKCIIGANDVFVLNFCNRDLTKMLKLIQDYKVVELDTYCKFIVEEPVFLEYKLEKSETIQLTEIQKKLEKENIELKNIKETLLKDLQKVMTDNLRLQDELKSCKNKTPKEYCVITFGPGQIYQLEKHVNINIEKGWTVFGNLVADESYVYQPMVKY